MSQIKNITNLLLDIKTSRDIQNSVINLNLKEEKSNNFRNNNDIIIKNTKNINEKDTLKILKNDEIEKNISQWIIMEKYFF